MTNAQFCCRVCGYESETLHWGVDGKCPDYDFCACCGVEHGYQDFYLAGARIYSEKWIQSGAKWDEKKLKPGNWYWKIN
jgi:hypothetical protein